MHTDAQTTHPDSYIGHHAYGKTSAIYVAADQNRDLKPTVKFEGTRRDKGWQDKLQIQVTPHDLPLVTACIAGFVSSIELTRYGADHSKSLGLKHQANQLFVRMEDGNKPVIAVPVVDRDRYFILNVCLRQLQMATPWISVSDVLNVLKTNFTARQEMAGESQ